MGQELRGTPSLVDVPRIHTTELVDTDMSRQRHHLHASEKSEHEASLCLRPFPNAKEGTWSGPSRIALLFHPSSPSFRPLFVFRQTLR